MTKFKVSSLTLFAVQTFAFLLADALAGSLGSGVSVLLAEPVPSSLQERIALQGHIARIKRVRYGFDGMTLATASFDGTVKLWDGEKGIERLTLQVNPGGRVLDVAISPDGTTIATVGGDWSVCLWDAKSGRELQKVDNFKEEVASVQFSPDGKTLIVGGGLHDPKYGRTLEKGGNGHGTLWFFDPQTGKERFANVRAHFSRISHLQFTRDGKHLVTAADGNTVKVWRWVNDTSPSESQSISIGTNPQDMILDVAVSPDGKTLAVVSQPSSIELFDFETGRKQSSLLNLEAASPIYWECVAFSHDGKQLLVGGALQEVVGDFEVFERSELRIWDLKTRALEKTLKVDEFVRSIAVSPDGRELSVGCGGRQKAPNRQRTSDEMTVESRGVVFRWGVPQH